MLASFSAEILKLYKRPTAWVLLIVALVLSQVFNYLVPYAGYLTAENERAAEQILESTMRSPSPCSRSCSPSSFSEPSRATR